MKFANWFLIKLVWPFDQSLQASVGKADLPGKMPYQQYPLGAEKTSVKANLIFWKRQDKVNLKLENIFFYFVGLISSIKNYLDRLFTPF